MSKKRSIWKSCECCEYAWNDGWDTYCKRTYRHAKWITWKKWDECEGFKPKKTCKTCEEYPTCSCIILIIADKECPRSKVCGCCDKYTPNIEMNLYGEGCI